MRGVRLLVCGWLTVLLSAACSAPSDDPAADQGEPPITDMLNVTDLRTFTLPLDPYRISEENLASSVAAETVLIQKCMRRFGITYLQPPRAPNHDVVGAQRRYGLADEQAAKTFGYHSPPAPPPVGQEQGPELSAAAMSVLRGIGQSSYAGQKVPDGGCVGEARRTLAAGAPTVANERLGDQLAAESFHRMENDSRVRDGFSAWSRCMKQAGHDYANPWMANDDPEFGGQLPTARELLVASADVKCKKETNMINIMASVETAYQQRALHVHAQELQALRKNIEAREKNAAIVLAAPN